MATIDLQNTARNQPEAIHAGLMAAVCKISTSATTSAGDVLRIGKLPHGAIPVEAVWYPGPAYNGSMLRLGTSASHEAFFASGSYATVSRTTRRLGHQAQISVPDDAPVRYEHIVAVAVGALSVGHHGDLVVFYRMPGQQP